jgi:hypothetical protein
MTIDHRSSVTPLDGAGLCAEYGLHVIPVWRPTEGACPCPRGAACVSPGKHPAIDSWQTAASTDLTILRDWFAAGTHNIGVVCGPSNVVVIDIDPRNGGDATFARLVDELGPLPQTVTADSGGGGTHFVFRRPSGDLESKLGDGLDLLRDSRQFLVEPSLHPSGAMYRWRGGLAPDETVIATLPEAWVRRVRRQARKPLSIPATVTTDARVERARRYLSKLPPAISGSGGHTALFNAVACAMLGFDLDTDAVRSLIAEYNLRCDPTWSEREIEHKLRSVAERCDRPRGYLLEPNRAPVVTSRQAADSATHQAEPVTVGADDWQDEIIPKKDGMPKRFYHNTEVFIRLFSDYRGRWSLNTMTGEPWFDGHPVREALVSALRAHVERRMDYTPSVADVQAAILVAAEERPFHPVHQYLHSIDWDGQPRLAQAARDHLGAEAPLYAQMVRRWMIGAVARAMQPGCKLDTALMLHGKQGLGKSTFFSILGGSWHSDSTIDISNKDSYQQIHAAWIYEFSELENVVSGRAESRLKAFMTSTHDLFRAPYARAVTSRARSVALCGSTNRREILTDDTGSRRFWIVPVEHEIDRDELAHARDQLWAEARAAYEAGEPWWFDRHLEAEREEANEDYETEDAWQEPIAEYLAPPTRVEVTTSRILTEAIRLDIAKQDRFAQMRVGRLVKQLGWEKRRTGGRGDRGWVFVRPAAQKGLGL